MTRHRLFGALVLVAAFLSIALDGAPEQPYLSAAVDAARWIRASAIKTDAGLTWPANPLDPKSANTGLYSGTPGIVLFLLEMHRTTGQADYLAEARAGADELIASVAAQKESGLYTGIAGTGFVLGEMYRATSDTRYLHAGRVIVRVLTDRAAVKGKGVQWNEVTDIIGGSAGAGLFLLYAADVLKDPGAITLAAKAADRLLELGVAEHGGLRWAMDPKFPRLMPNFSHGTAGIAYFLAAVHQATKEPRYLDAALAGARYIQAIAKTEGDICLVPHHQPDGLDLYYLGWCHGPVGTARLWRKLAQVTGDAQWDAWVDKSARALLQSGIPESRTDGYWNNVSQCCGAAGVAQFFLDLHGVARRQRDERFLNFAKKMTVDLLARGTRDGKGLRWVQAENRTQPDNLVAQTGYMQGAAGIGLWLLRMHAAGEGQRGFVRFPDSPWQ